MRVLFTVSDWPSHYFAMVPTAWALQSAGHEVRVVCAGSQTHTLQQAGLLPVPLLRPAMDMMVQNRVFTYWEAQAGRWPHARPPAHPVTGEPMNSLDDFDMAAFRRQNKARFAEMTARNFDVTVDFARRWKPGLVLHDRMSLEGILAARVTGVASVLHLWGPHGTAEPEPELRAIPGDSSRSFPRHGAPDMDMNLITQVIDPCPPGIRPPLHAARIPVRYVPYNGSGTSAEPLPAKKRPRVCIAWGRSLARVYGDNARILPGILDALGALDIEVLLVAGPHDVQEAQGARTLSGGRLGSARFLTRQDVPLHLVLPGCDAVVHCAGAGTTMTAMAAGLPQTGIPFAAEPELNIRRIERAGAGIAVPAHREALPEAVATAVRRLVEEPSYRTAARLLARENQDRPSPARLATALERIAAGQPVDQFSTTP